MPMGSSILRKRSMHRKKRFTSFLSLAGMSLTKLPLGRNNSVRTSLFPPRESLVANLFYGVARKSNIRKIIFQEGGGGLLYLILKRFACVNKYIIETQ
jgi:hypothetical protein